MLKISYAGCLGLSPAISSQFSVEMCAASKNCEKFTKTPFLGVQGRSRWSVFINLKSLSPVLVYCQPIRTCHRPMQRYQRRPRTRCGLATIYASQTTDWQTIDKRQLVPHKLTDGLIK